MFFGNLQFCHRLLCGARQFLQLSQVIQVMPSHGLDDGLKSHRAALRMRDGTVSRSWKRNPNEPQVPSPQRHEDHERLACRNARIGCRPLLLVEGLNRRGVFGQRLTKAEGEDEPPPLDLDEVQVWDLLDAFSRLMKEVGTRKPRYHEVTYDDTPIDLHAADIEDRLKREGKLTLRALIEGRKSRSEMIGVFLALLELIREKKILVTQAEALGDVEIVPAPEEHRKTYEYASLHLSPEANQPSGSAQVGAAGTAGSGGGSANVPVDAAAPAANEAEAHETPKIPTE